MGKNSVPRVCNRASCHISFHMTYGIWLRTQPRKFSSQTRLKPWVPLALPVLVNTFRDMGLHWRSQWHTTQLSRCVGNLVKFVGHRRCCVRCGTRPTLADSWFPRIETRRAPRGGVPENTLRTRQTPQQIRISRAAVTAAALFDRFQRMVAVWFVENQHLVSGIGRAIGRHRTFGNAAFLLDSFPSSQDANTGGGHGGRNRGGESLACQVGDG